MDPLVALILSNPGMAERLLDKHLDDGGGHCQVCALGGGHGYRVWPCQIRLAACAAATRVSKSARR